MKKLIALALVLCMALSMMVLTASAYLAPEPPTLVCTNPNHKVHYFIIEGLNDPDFGDFYKFKRIDVDGPNNWSEVNQMFKSVLHGMFGKDALQPGELYYYNAQTGEGGPCTNTPAQPQPKTGVLDTLPLWFGVMAVSACAYVLTSKKRGF